MLFREGREVKVGIHSPRLPTEKLRCVVMPYHLLELCPIKGTLKWGTENGVEDELFGTDFARVGEGSYEGVLRLY